MVFKIVEIIGIPQQEISKRKSCPGDTGKGSETRLTGNTEIECSAGNVGLRVVIPPDLELEAKMKLMMASQRRDTWRYVILGIAVLNEALALGAHDVVGKVSHARRRRRAHFGGHRRVIARRPADGCQVETRVLRAPVIGKPAYTRIESNYSCWRYVVCISRGQGIGVIVLSAAVGAKACFQRVNGQIKNVPIIKAQEQPLFIGDVMVQAPNELIMISSRGRGCCEVVRLRAEVGRPGPESEQFHGSRVDPDWGNYVVLKRCWVRGAPWSGPLCIYISSTLSLNLLI